MPKPTNLQSVGPYDLLAKIGHGGMSTVFKARHKTTGELVAVKVANRRVTDNPTLTKRFHTDYVVASEVLHPHLVRGLDHGEEQGTPYLVMELVVGQSLDQRLKKTGPLPEAEAVAVFNQIGKALQFLHENKIIHRDIKPGNILVSETGVAKLADFGLGKDLKSDSQVTQSRVGLGTLEYAAPEQFDDAKHVDASCDIYSLAATLYVALAGKYPFGTGGMYHVLQKKQNNQFTPLSQLVPTISPAIDQIVRRSLNAEPRMRPAGCKEFLAALNHAPGAPLVSVPPPAPAAPPPAERRASVRYGVQLESTCLPLAAGAEWWDAKVIDASAHGLCLQLPRRFEPKTTLQVMLDLSAADAGGTILVQTRWVKQLDNQSWLIGCSFLTPLGDHDLEKLLASGSEPTRAEGSPP